ncbi:heme ABC transporter ATP-binding protein [Cytophagaceae bacterium DM2B3-1]|uniref:Heme ABC transporter ATP-binding protein n=1 Tax=Xanthocytophaga flava TaxID=3048013 RepID=A0ABT7CRY1_9BACT|nr:heme ABC transporter ATP-binding protein [Xanthocytophaga flavus]MDJ1496516.1 heme ABC transporter ATP-binding protein [Xanthocytophaga flavus]
MINVEKVGYHIAGRPLLQNVSFVAETGQLLAIIGANGAGKSTLLKILSKELAPDSGKVEMRGENLKSIRNNQLARFRAVLAQNNALAFNFNVSELVMMGRYPHFDGSPSKQDHEIVEYALQQTDITHLRDRIFLTLSGGEQQRVLLAKVLAQLTDIEDIYGLPHPVPQPKYLLLDEPITGLDLYHQHNLLEIIRTLTLRNFCVIAILHDLNLTMQYADKVLILNSGKTIAFGKPVQVMTPANIFSAFHIPVDIIHPPEYTHPFIVHSRSFSEQPLQEERWERSNGQSKSLYL